MPLARNKSIDQLKKVRNMTKKQGGDIADKVNKDEKKLPNLSYMHDPSDIKIDTYEDNYSLGNKEKFKVRKMKHVKTFEQHNYYSTILNMMKNNQINLDEAEIIINNINMPDVMKKDIIKSIRKDYNEFKKEQRKLKLDSMSEKFDFPFGAEQIPEFYLKQWLDKYSKYCEENKVKQQYEDFNSVRGDIDAIATVFDFANKYSKDHNEIMDGKEFAIMMNEDRNVDFLRIGKNIKFNNIDGIINRIVGKYVLIDVNSENGLETIKVPIIKILKNYKKLPYGGFDYNEYK